MDVNADSGWGDCRAPWAYTLYEVLPSTVPGAGLGVFAKTRIPVGTVWSLVNSREEGVMFLSRWVHACSAHVCAGRVQQLPAI